LVKNRAASATSITKRLDRDMQSPDEVVRGDALRSLCPCHAGWEAFEQNVTIVFRSLRDRSRVVRAHALHVFEDAVRMQSVEELRYYLEHGEERIGEKRCRFRSMQQRLEARRRNKIRRLQGR
jgi:hypothetical protein